MASSNSTLQGLLNSVVREVRHPRFTSDFTWSFVVTCAIGGVTLLLMFLTDINQIKETRRETEEETATYRYEGEKDESGLPNGWGEMQWSDGEAYEGEWAHGAREGHGTMLFANGDVFVGYFKDNARHGVGIYAYILSGEGVRWNSTKEKAVRLVNGKKAELISFEDSKKIAMRLKDKQDAATAT